jgi:hypothetical protein
MRLTQKGGQANPTKPSHRPCTTIIRLADRDWPNASVISFPYRSIAHDNVLYHAQIWAAGKGFSGVVWIDNVTIV